MNFIEPVKTFLSTQHEGETFEKEFFQIGTVTGADAENVAEYNSTNTYNTADEVLVSSLGSIYKCTGEGVSGKFPPANPSEWVFSRYENQYRMFAIGEDIGAKTTGTDMKIVLPFSMCGAVSLLMAEFTTATLTHKDSAGNVLGEVEVTGIDISCRDLYEFCTKPPVQKEMVVEEFFNYAGSTLEIQFVGRVSIETLAVGVLERLGALIVGGKMSLSDESRYQESAITGFLGIQKRIVVKNFDGEVLVQNSDFDLLAKNSEKIFGKYVVFVPIKDDKFQSIQIGRLTAIDIPIEAGTAITCPISIEGVKIATNF